MSYQRVEGNEPISDQTLLNKNHALEDEIKNLRARLAEAEELQRAISEGDLDALVIPTPEGELVFTLDSADYAYRVLVETMNEGTVTLGFDGTILYCNRRFAELLSMQTQDIVGKSIYQFIASESKIDFNTLLKHKMNAGEIYLKVENGRSLPTYLSISSLQGANSPNAWCLVVTDLTEQKKNEEIVASERLARSIIEQAEETIVVCDTSGRIISFSKSLPKLCGCDPTDQRFEFLLNLRLSEWTDESERFLPVSSALRGSIIHGMEVFIERENRQKLIVLLNAGPLKKADGEIIGCTVTLTDITERKQTEEALYNAYQKLQEQSEELKKFGEELQAHSEEVHSQNEELKSQSEEIQKANEALLESEKRFKLLSEANALLLVSKDPVKTIQIIAEKVMHHLNCDVFFNYVLDKIQDKLRLNAYAGINAETAKGIEWLDKGSAICGSVALDGCRIVSEDVQHNGDKRAELVRSMGIQAYACQPLLIGEKAIGSLSFGTKSREKFTDDELALMSTVADQVSVAIEHKRVEEELTAAYNQIQSIIDNTPDIIYAFDLEGCFMLANTALANVLNSTPDRMIGKRRHEFMRKKDADWHEANDRQVFEAGRVLEFEEHSHFEDRSITWLTKKFPLRDAQGRIYAIAGISANISERKQMEEQIRQRAEELEMVMDVAPVAIWIGHDPQSHYITGNRKANEFYEAEIGVNVSANVAPLRRFFYKGCELDADEFPMQQASLKNIDIRDSEFDVLLPSGEWRTLLGSASPLHDANGHVRGSVGAFIDITERKKAEVKLKHTLGNLDKLVKERTAELEKAYNSLKESERSLAEAQQIAHIGNWSRDIVTGEVHWSDEVYRIFGFKPQEFGISYDSFLSQVVPENREYVINTGKQALNGKLFEIEYKIIRADGLERAVHENVKVIFDEENNSFRLIGTIQDITERKNAEEAMARIDIARKKEIHHRIKNNLQVISSLLDLQAEQFKNKECIKDSEVLEAFRESQDRVISMALIHEELYKGGGFETLNFSPYIHELAENLFQTYSVGNNNISLKLDLEENTYLDMDLAVPLGIIVNELVTNSLKHAFKGRESGVIHIKLSQEENEDCLTSDEDCTTLVLIVSDNGIGIPEDLEIEELDSLGMQLVITLVDQLDGELEIKRENGTEFTVRFTVPENNNSTKEASLPRMSAND